jgi:general secretion pathway protein A
MLAALLSAFGNVVPGGETRAELLDRLNQFLLAQLTLGKRCVAIFDEAQHVSLEFLEQIRVLSNLETDREKLIQIVLVGQRELLDKLRAPQMAQLDQRVTIRCTLGDLDRPETERYIGHRLDVAGARDQVRFSTRAVKEIHRASHGVPRIINLISDRALLAGFASQTHDIQPVHVRKAVAALRGDDANGHAHAREQRRSWGRRIAAVVVVGAVAAATAGVALWPRYAIGPDESAYRRTMAASSATDAEHVLNAFVQGFGASKHWDDAVLRLAQLEISRGDRAAAIQHLQRLADHAPAPLDKTRALVFVSQARLDSGDTTSACQSLSPELASTTGADTSLAHQLTTIASLCAERGNVSSTGAAPDTTTHPVIVRDTVPRPSAKRGSTAGAAP